MDENKRARAGGRSDPRRPGAITVLMAFLMIVLVAMVAFAVDIGYICRVHAELQNAADAAALAAAQKALKAAVVSDSETNSVAISTIFAAHLAAHDYAGRHKAGGVTLRLRISDVVVGYQAVPGSEPVTAWSSGQPVPNCVQVTTRRDSTANGSLPLFFARVLGTSHSNLSATAVAAFDKDKYRVTGFDSDSANGKLLPLAVNINTWNQFVATGRSPDGVRRDDYTLELTLPNSPVQAPDNVSDDGDNTPELVGTFGSAHTPGDFVLVQFDASGGSPSTPAAASWIRSGPTPYDMSGFGPQGMQATPENPLMLPGGTGMKSSLMEDLKSVIGQPRVVPLYSSYAGNGNNRQFAIVGFAGISVVAANGTGNHMKVVAQPAIVIDPTATSTTGTTTTVTEFVYPGLPISLVR
jgi:Flp pilus assembly protein TadG